MMTDIPLYNVLPDGKIDIPADYVVPLTFIFKSVGFSLDKIKDVESFESIWKAHIGFQLEDLLQKWLKTRSVSLERNALAAALYDSDEEFDRLLSLLKRRNALGLKVVD